MSNVLGIICEYNPFHNGHLYHLNEAKKLTNSDYSVAVISGNFSQRGDPAIVSKWIKTEMALKCGVDLVLELPTIYSISSAENFAYGAIKILDSLNLVDYLCFGSECGDISILDDIVQVLVEEPKAYRTLLSHELSTGVSFPKAREKALMMYLGNMRRFANVLSSPNNILGIEYLKALKRRKSAILPAAIRRKGQGYHDTSVPLDSSFASASFLRKSFRELSSLDGTFIPSRDSFLSQIPEPALSACIQEGALFTPVFPDDLSAQLQYRLLQAVRGHEDLSRYADVSPELADRLLKLVLSPADFSRRIEQLKTKQYTYTRISRALIHLLLNLTREAQQQQKEADYVSYIRILGFRKSAGPLLNAMKKNASLPIITKTANAGKLLSPQALNWFEQDLFSSHFYQSIAAQKGRTMKNEYTRSVILYP